MWTEIEIRMAGVLPEHRPSVARVAGTWNAHAPQFDTVTRYRGAFEVSAAMESTMANDPDKLSMTARSSGNFEGVDAFAVALSARFPLVEIYTNEEWTGDEPSIDRALYRGGALVEVSGGSALVPVVESSGSRRVTHDQYAALCDVIDRAKNDDRSEDTDVYAGAALDALGLSTDADHSRQVAAALADYDAAEATYAAAVEDDATDIPSSVYHAHDDALASVAHTLAASLRPVPAATVGTLTAALNRFLSIIPNIDDGARALTCTEAEAIAGVFTAMGHADVAATFITSHAYGDDDGADMHRAEYLSLHNLPDDYDGEDDEDEGLTGRTLHV